MRNTVGKKHFPEACKNSECIVGADKRLFLWQTYKVSGLAAKSTGALRTQQEDTNTQNEHWHYQPLPRDPGVPAQKGGVLTAFRRATQEWSATMSLQHALHSTGLLQGASIPLGSAEKTIPSPFLSAAVVLPQQQRWKCRQHGAPGTARHTQPRIRIGFKPFRHKVS